MSTTIAVRSPEAERGSGMGSDRIGLAGPTVTLCLIIAGAVLFNVFPEKVGYYKTVTDPTSFVPLLSCGFAAFLPWLNLWWALAFCLQVVHFALGRWTIATRSLQWGLDVLGATVLITLSRGEAFLQVPVATFAVRAALALTGFLMLLGALVQFVKLLKRLAVSA